MTPGGTLLGGATANARVLLIVAVALVAYAALAYGYVTRTPIWQNPDEPAHYNYVAYVARTGGLPELKNGDWDSALLERVKNGTLQPGDDVGSIRYESWQPPLFYLLAAPVFKLGPQDEWSTLLRLRALDAVFGAATLVVAYFVAREALEPTVAASVPLVIAGVPMFTAVSAALSADPLANLFAALTVLALVRARATPLRFGVLLGVGLLTKLALAIFVPLTLVVIAMKSKRPILDSAVVIVVTALVAIPWLVHQVTTYGITDPLAFARHSAVVADQPRFPGLSASYVVQFLTTSFQSFWAQFGWMAIVAPARLYLIWGVVTFLAAIGLVIKRKQLEDRVWQLLLATVVLAFIAYVGYNLTFEQFQGRYLFPALVPMAILAVAGWAALAPVRLRQWPPLAFGVALILLNGYALSRVLSAGFAPPT